MGCAGPLPPAWLQEGCDLVYKGRAEGILSMAEAKQAHRFEWEREEPHCKTRSALLDKWLAFVISTICVGSAAYLAISGQPRVAGGLAGTSTVTLAGRLIDGRLKGR